MKEEIMSEETNREFAGAAILVIFILWNFAILFGLWGGNPEGCFVKIKNLQAQVEVQAEQIEVMRCQLGQLEPNKKVLKHKNITERK